jgi:hypothetical protein
MMTKTRQVEVLDFGFSLMKHVGAPTLALWLAEDGWEGGSTIVARRFSPEDPEVEVTLKHWETLLFLSPYLSPN